MVETLTTARAPGGGYREVWKLAWPLILGMMSFTLMEFCDRVFLGRYSAVSFQAALPAGILSFLFIIAFQTIAAYSGTFAAHFWGAGRPADCIRATMQGVWFSIFSYPLILLALPLGSVCMEWSGHAPGLMAEEKVYYGILIGGGVFSSVGAALNGYFAGVSRTRVIFAVNAAECLLNVVLDYAMIFGRLGFPEGGIRGAAVATVISCAVWAAMFAALFGRAVARERRRGLGPDWWKPDRALLGRLLRLGCPSGVQAFFEFSSFTAFVMLMGRFGGDSLTASNIAFSVNALAYAPLMGFGLAASTAVAQHIGAGELPVAVRATRSTMHLAELFVAAVGLTFVLFPGVYFSLFRPGGAGAPSDGLLAVGIPMMQLMTVWGLFDAVNIVYEGALKGAGDTLFVMLYFSGVNWLLLIPSVVLAIYRGGGVLTLWALLALSVLVSAGGIYLRWRGGGWKRRRLL